MDEAAANEIESIVLFQDPLPDAQRAETILPTVWTGIETKIATDIERRDTGIDSYVR